MWSLSKMDSSNSSSGSNVSTEPPATDGAVNTILNIDSKDQSLWLVKIPQFVAEKWATLSNDDVLGTFSVTVPSGQTNKKQLNIQLNAAKWSSESSSGPFPTEFALEEISKGSGSGSAGDDFYALTSKESNEGDIQFSLDGRITKNLLLKPKDTSKYHEFLRDRQQKSRLKWRKETVLADVNDLQRSALQPQVIDLVTSHRAELKRKQNQLESKQHSLVPAFVSDGSAPTASAYIRNRIFYAFSLDDRQSLKDILSLCNAGAAAAGVVIRDDDVKETLKEFARYNAKGMYKTFWELKPEFRDHSTSNREG